MPFGPYAHPDWDKDSHKEIPDPRQKLMVDGHILNIAIEPGILLEGGKKDVGPYRDVMILTSGRVLMLCETTGKISNSPFGLQAPKYNGEIDSQAIIFAARAAGILPDAESYSVH